MPKAPGPPPAVPADGPDALPRALSALEEALSHGPTQRASGPALVAALKGAWLAARAHVAEVNRHRGGREAGEALADICDSILRRLLDRAASRAGFAPGTPGLALLAMGSYGRREPAPFSDLDLLVLYSPDPTEGAQSRLETLLSTLFRPLWDAGLQLGHAVRTPEECLAAMEEATAEEEALESATALLEARFVAGEEALADVFLKRDLRDFFRRRGRPFVEAKLEEAIRRHHREGESVYRTQPHLKDSPGALRDYQLSLWIDRASQLSGHLPRLAQRPLVRPEDIEEARQGHARLLTLRIALHAACGRKQDVLDFEMQETLAEALGYAETEEWRASELLLRDYFRAATAVHRLADTVIRRYREEQALAARDLEQLRRRPVDQDYTRIGDYLYLARPDVLQGAEWLAVALRGFLLCSQLGVSLGQEVLAAIRARLPLDESARCGPEAASLFLALLQRRANAAPALRAMRDGGLLGEYLPEFGQIEGLVIHDVYHDFTVDEHTLFTLDAVDQMSRTGVPGHPQRRRAMLERLRRVDLLRLACLCHDLGKSRGGAGHSQRGALMVPAIAHRLGLSEPDTRLLIFLVENHLLLSKTSFRRDTGDERLLEDLAAQVGTRERLEYLYLLTYVDASSVGQGSFPNWKDDLMMELYERLEERLARAAAGPAGPAAEGLSLEAQLTAAAPDDAARAAAREHCQRVPPRYLVEVGFEEARLHLDLLRTMREQQREAVAAVRGSGALVDVWIASTDRPRRFAQICGALLGAGANIVSAIAFTRSDGLILDHFRVSLAPGSPVSPAQADGEFWRRAGETVVQVLSGKADFRPNLEAARRRVPRGPQISRRLPSEVRLDNKLAERYTVLDVICGERVGLLYALSRALADLGCDIHFAKADTQQGVVTAVYYVTELGGGKILDTEKAYHVRLLLRAVAEDFQAFRR